MDQIHVQVRLISELTPEAITEGANIIITSSLKTIPLSQGIKINHYEFDIDVDSKRANLFINPYLNYPSLTFSKFFVGIANYLSIITARQLDITLYVDTQSDLAIDHAIMLLSNMEAIVHCSDPSCKALLDVNRDSEFLQNLLKHFSSVFPFPRSMMGNAEKHYIELLDNNEWISMGTSQKPHSLEDTKLRLASLRTTYPNKRFRIVYQAFKQEVVMEDPRRIIFSD